MDSKERIEKGGKHWLDSILFFRVYRLLFEETRRVLCCSSDKDKTKNKDLEQNKDQPAKVQGSKIRPLLVFITALCIVNVALCSYFAYEASTGYVTASNHILYLFMINMFIYLFYYWFMKYKSGEWLEWRPRIYLGKII